MISRLIQLANTLDHNGFVKEANMVDRLIRLAQQDPYAPSQQDVAKAFVELVRKAEYVAGVLKPIQAKDPNDQKQIQHVASVLDSFVAKEGSKTEKQLAETAAADAHKLKVWMQESDDRYGTRIIIEKNARDKVNAWIELKNMVSGWQ